MYGAGEVGSSIPSASPSPSGTRVKPMVTQLSFDNRDLQVSRVESVYERKRGEREGERRRGRGEKERQGGRGRGGGKVERREAERQRETQRESMCVGRCIIHLQYKPIYIHTFSIRISCRLWLP